MIETIVISGACLFVGIGLGIFLFRRKAERRLSEIEAEAQRILSKAEKEANDLRKDAALQAKDILFQAKLELDRETKEKKEQLQSLEKRLLHKEETLDRKMEQLERKESRLLERERALEKLEGELKRKEQEAERLLEEQQRKLEEIACISRDEAKAILIRSLEEEARQEAARIVRRIEAEAKEQADRKAQEILALAVKRYSGEYVAENTVSVVTLPNEEMKGRIIGREGRNIRAIEAATGVDIIIDDTPEAVILSAFNPIRREVARISLQRLIEDGRIHPGRIEEVVAKVDKEIEASIKEAGEQAAFDVGVHGIHPELIRLLGRLKYRSSYAQNVLRHSKEVSFLAGIMASELGINVKQAKRAGLLHDIGKAVDHEVEGPHALIGADLAKRYGEPPQVVHAIASHHEDVPPESVLAVLVQAADTLSGARPGARQETYESYVKRLEELERIAMSFHGVTKSYAIQAGRELRIIVESRLVDDDQAYMLCKEIAKRIEKELTYPGQIKVTVIRETRAVEYAR